MAMNPKDKHILITNIQFVTIGDVRTFCNALLLSDRKGDALFGGCTVRGFGPDPAWPVFDIRVSSIDYEIGRAESPHRFIGQTGKERPMFSGAIIKMADRGPELQVVIENEEHDLDVFVFDHGEDIGRVWNRLTMKTREYWHAPNMPFLHWGRP